LMWAMVPLCNQQNQCENYYVKGMLWEKKEVGVVKLLVE
jgi:hypothetical protein